MDDQVAELIEAMDMNALLRVVDGYCSSGRWEDLLEVADLCDEAAGRGKQVWPIAAHIEYRIALEAPGELAASVLDSELGRFTLGPLSEVAASTHTWDELASHALMPHIAAYVAQERVLRGEDLTGDPRAHQDVLELPLRLERWEPTYALATYRSNLVEVAEPWDTKAPLHTVEPESGEPLDEPDLTTALLDLVAPWTNESNGAARAVVVEGSAAEAAAALTLGPLRIGPLEPAEAMQRLAWAAASGGAHGNRRGAALGRSLAWHLASLLTETSWPPDPEILGVRIAKELTWYRWDEGAPEEGWILRIAVEDRMNGWSACVAATDLLQENLS